MVLLKIMAQKEKIIPTTKPQDIENGGADQDDDTHKFHGIAKFKAGLGVGGDGDRNPCTAWFRS